MPNNPTSTGRDATTAFTTRSIRRSWALPKLDRSVATLLYGSGLRLIECHRLRVKDIDIEQRQTVVRDGEVEGFRTHLSAGSLAGQRNNYRIDSGGLQPAVFVVFHV